MKFKFLGENESFCLELVRFGIKGKHGDYLNKGDIIEVPNDKKIVIDSLDESGLFARVNESKKIIKKENK